MYFLKNYIQSKDWIAKWYIVAKERGSNTNALIGRKNHETNELEEFYFCHSKHDGMGFMLDHFERNNIKLKKSLNAKFKEAPSLIKNFFKIYKGLTQVQVNKVPWIDFDIKRSQKINPQRHTIYFTESETKRIHSYIRTSKTSENAFLLKEISNFLLPILKKESQAKWLFPINMRGNITRHNPQQNISSGIYLNFNNVETYKSIKNKIKTGFINKDHWVNWWCFHISIFLTKNIMKKISLKSSKNSFFLGSFTNMGRWTQEDIESAEDLNKYSYIVAPPGTPNYPLGIGVFTWFGRLTITIKIHPSILADQSKIKGFSEQIKENIINLV